MKRSNLKKFNLGGIFESEFPDSFRYLFGLVNFKQLVLIFASFFPSNSIISNKILELENVQGKWPQPRLKTTF